MKSLEIPWVPRGQSPNGMYDHRGYQIAIVNWLPQNTVTANKAETLLHHGFSFIEQHAPSHPYFEYGYRFLIRKAAPADRLTCENHQELAADLWAEMSATIVVVELLAAKLSTHPRCATLQDRDREPGALRLTTSALSCLGHDACTIFRRVIRELSHQTLKMTHITSRTRKLSDGSDHGKGRMPQQMASAPMMGSRARGAKRQA